MSSQGIPRNNPDRIIRSLEALYEPLQNFQKLTGRDRAVEKKMLARTRMQTSNGQLSYETDMKTYNFFERQWKRFKSKINQSGPKTYTTIRAKKKTKLLRICRLN